MTTADKHASALLLALSLNLVGVGGQAVTR